MSREEEMTTMTNIIYGLRHMGARDVNRTRIPACSDYTYTMYKPTLLYSLIIIYVMYAFYIHSYRVDIKTRPRRNNNRKLKVLKYPCSIRHTLADDGHL